MLYYSLPAFLGYSREVELLLFFVSQTLDKSWTWSLGHSEPPHVVSLKLSTCLSQSFPSSNCPPTTWLLLQTHSAFSIPLPISRPLLRLQFTCSSVLHFITHKIVSKLPFYFTKEIKNPENGTSISLVTRLTCTAWVKSKLVMRSERNQTPQITYCMTAYISAFRIFKINLKWQK